MSLKNIYAGDYGQEIELTFIDVDTDFVADISGYSSAIQMIFTKPDESIVAKTATFKSDGTDGAICYTVESGFLIAGNWKVRGRVSSGSAQLTTENHSFTVNS